MPVADAAMTFSLFPVRADRWRNLVFVNLDPDAAELHDDLGAFFAEAEPFPIESFHHGGDLAHDLACNWKTYVDNYVEGYHIPRHEAGVAQFQQLVRTALNQAALEQPE